MQVRAGAIVWLLIAAVLENPVMATTAAIGAAKIAPTATQYDPENAGPLTPGNLSVGKFYRFSRSPAVAWPDAFDSRWSDGSKLTDDGPVDETRVPAASECVGWQSAESVEITIDLGRPQSLERAVLSVVVGKLTPDGARATAPRQIEVRTKTEDGWKPFAKTVLVPSGRNETVCQIELIGDPRLVRFVRLVLLPSGGEHDLLVLRQINLLGKIRNTWRCVPSVGCLHGAFPTSAGFSHDAANVRPGMVVEKFEKLVGKKIAMALWYQTMEPGQRFAAIANLRADHLAENYSGCRYLCVGWLPKVSTVAVAEGAFDGYFAEYFADAADPAILRDSDQPIWFRPMNEFNGGWVRWGLNPDSFRRAWRRMYNIAEQTGAAGRHIFVWSPNSLSFPDQPWNRMERYYPGDQYVDWVGVSAYPHSAHAVKDEDHRYPVECVAEVYDLYADHKPIMVSEGGFSDNVDRVRWVNEWFDGLRTKRPKIRCLIWENHHTRIISSDEKALAAYRRLVQNDYWIAETGKGAKTR